ncbi:MAG: universal stress protein, partial [Myxococcota bacterium]
MVTAPRRMLIPVDDSQASVAALQVGYRLATYFRSSIHLLHAAYTPPHIAPERAVQMVTGQSLTTVGAIALEAGGHRMNALVAEHPPPPEVTVTTEVQYGLPLQVVGATASAYDLVIVGTHNARGLAGLFAGCTSERVIRHIDGPVLVARPCVFPMRRICVAVDFSQPSVAAVDYGVMLAKRLDAMLHFVHVTPPLSALESFGLHVMSSPNEPSVSLHDYAWTQARQALRRFLDRDFSGVEMHMEVRMGDPADEIVAAAEAMEASLIVMGTHGQTASGVVGLGSVADRVVRTANCSVLTTRS